jgi:hypothetical protein
MVPLWYIPMVHVFEMMLFFILINKIDYFNLKLIN